MAVSRGHGATRRGSATETTPGTPQADVKNRNLSSALEDGPFQHASILNDDMHWRNGKNRVLIQHHLPVGYRVYRQTDPVIGRRERQSFNLIDNAPGSLDLFHRVLGMALQRLSGDLTQKRRGASIDMKCEVIKYPVKRQGEDLVDLVAVFASDSSRRYSPRSLRTGAALSSEQFHAGCQSIHDVLATDYTEYVTGKMISIFCGNSATIEFEALIAATTSDNESSGDTIT
jgi:hypothetical protein